MKNLKLLRNNANLTQRELAEKVKIPKTNIGHYEVGITEPSIETLIKLADYFNCSVDYLLGHETQGIVHLDSFTAQQRKLIEKIKTMDEHDLAILEGVMIRLEQEKQNPWLVT